MFARLGSCVTVYFWGGDAYAVDFVSPDAGTDGRRRVLWRPLGTKNAECGIPHIHNQLTP
jgi:hypothetical protein